MTGMGANCSGRTHSPNLTGKAVLVVVRISYLNSNHFYNQVQMRTFASFAKFYIPPRLDDLKNDGGLFYIDGGGDPLVKHWTSLYLFLQLSEANSDPAFRAKDPA